MQPYRRILIASDLTEFSEPALWRANELSRQYGAELHLLHVIEHFPEDRSNEWVAPEDRRPSEYVTDRAQDALDLLAAKLDRPNDDSVKPQVTTGPHSARHEIIAYAEENAIDLIVVGAHGPHWRETLTGSTASGVLHHAPCDVLVVRAAQ